MNINGKEVQLRFGTMAVKIYLNEMSKEEWVGEAYSSYGLAWIIYAGVFNYYSVMRIAMPVTFEDCYNHIEAIELGGGDMEEITKVVKEFEESQALRVVGEKINEANEELKKKLIGTKSEKPVLKRVSSRKK